MTSERPGTAAGGASPVPPSPHDLAPDIQDVFATLPAAAWREAWEHAPVLVTVVVGREQRVAFQNRASRAVFGERALGVPLAEAFPEVGTGSAVLDRVLRTGEIVQMPPHRIEVKDLHGEDVVMSYVITPLGTPPVGAVVTAADVTARFRAEAQAARTRLVADVGAAMTRAADPAAALQALTDGLVPDVADLAAVYVILDDEDGSTPLPPDVMSMSDELARLGPPPPPDEDRGPSPYLPLLRTGAPVVIPLNGQETTNPAGAEWLSAARGHTLAVAPLVVGARLTGALVLLAVGDRPPYDDKDLPFLADVAARAGAAITQLRTMRRQRDVAVDLQRGLLPAEPPRVSGVQVAARYVAGAPDVEVGGDWWDVHDLGNRCLALGIGDVSGRGVPAAAVMGQARAVMRAAGHARLGPVQALELLDAQLSEALTVPETAGGVGSAATGWAPVRFATACYAILDLAAGEVRLANAGHLPLLVRSADGAVRRVQAAPGAPLGLRVGGFVEEVAPVRAGDTLVMFTDGLVESRTLDIDDGLAMLERALAAHGGADVEVVADQLLAAMQTRPGHGPDDVALVLLRVLG